MALRFHTVPQCCRNPTEVPPPSFLAAVFISKKGEINKQGKFSPNGVFCTKPNRGARTREEKGKKRGFIMLHRGFCRESKLVANLGNIPLILAEAPLGAKGKHLPQKPLVLLRALVLM